MSLMNFLSDSKTGAASTKRLVLLISCVALALSTLILAVAGYAGRDIGIAIAATATPLAGLAGYGYVNGKMVERRNNGDSNMDGR